MFKIESYVTPLILSYVDKYIKNIKPEDSQVSLWGGDAVFHNLDLRLDVLEAELHSPFTFSSGHIHELRIHVPWTKLASESIVITINTIECTLKLKSTEDRSSEKSSQSQKARLKRQEMAANSPAPGYIQSLMSKIVNNISIVCNNVILKYLEEDIVLSLNARTVTLTSVDNKWEQAFTELLAPELILRKLISVSDLTICLDQCNAQGKIPAYQEPLLYRCSLSVRMSSTYLNTKGVRASKLHVDFLFPKLDFSLSDQQVPMFIRLFKLALALYLGDFKPRFNGTETEYADGASEVAPGNPNDPGDDERDNAPSNTQSWAGWAWGYVPAILPLYWEEEVSDGVDVPSERERQVHLGVHVERLSWTFKWAEIIRDGSISGSSRLRFTPFLTLRMQGSFLEVTLGGVEWVDVQGGISHLTLEPTSSHCLCGAPEEVTLYFLQGCERSSFLRRSLFEPSREEDGVSPELPDGVFHWEHHMQSITEATLLERTPAIGFDYVYQLELPEENASEYLSHLGSEDLEYSDFAERALFRLAVGPLQLKISYGFCHRMSALLQAVQQYNYPDYGPSSRSLIRAPPPGRNITIGSQAEQIPRRTYQVAILRPLIFISLSPPHPAFDLQRLVERRVIRPLHSSSALLLRKHASVTSWPVLKIALTCADLRLVQPMYPVRLTLMVLQAPSNTFGQFFHQCHLDFQLKLHETSIELVTEDRRAEILKPCNASVCLRSLLIPELWKDQPDRILHTLSLEAEKMNVVVTRPQLDYVAAIWESLIKDPTSSFFTPTERLASEALKLDAQNPTLLLALGHPKIDYSLSKAATCYGLSMSSLEASVSQTQIPPTVVFRSTEQLTDTQNIIFIDSLIQVPSSLFRSSEPILWTDNDVMPIFSLKMASFNIWLHPAILDWFNYVSPEDLGDGTTAENAKLLPQTDPSILVSEGQESNRSIGARDSGLSSSMDGRTFHASSSLLFQSGKGSTEACTGSNASQIDWSACRHLLQRSIFYVDIQPSSLIIPTGCRGGMQLHFQLPGVSASCPHVQTTQFTLADLPFRPQAGSLSTSSSFPWTVTLQNFGMSTSAPESINLLRSVLAPVSLKCTIALNDKSRTVSEVQQSDATTPPGLDLCIHIDMNAVEVSLSVDQIDLLCDTVNHLSDWLSRFSSKEKKEIVYASGKDDTPELDFGLWLQWAMPRFLLTLESTAVRTVLDMEDVTTSVDLQRGQYAKLKSRLTAISIKLLTQSDDGVWEVEQTTNGIVLSVGGEDITQEFQLDGRYAGNGKSSALIATPPTNSVPLTKAVSPTLSENGEAYQQQQQQQQQPTAPASGTGGVLSITLTRAKRQHVYSKWQGQRRKSTQTEQGDGEGVIAQPDPNYLYELTMGVEAIDLVVTTTLLDHLNHLIQPLFSLKPPASAGTDTGPTLPTSNHTLPLMFANSKRLRFFLVDLEKSDEKQQMFLLLNLDGIELSPRVQNPIGRSGLLLKSDLYSEAEQNGILFVPGQDVEDRQYQIDLNGLSFSSGSWMEVGRASWVYKTMNPASSLHTMAENPALEWNARHLDQDLGSGSQPGPERVHLTPILTRCSLRLIYAPAIVSLDHSCVVAGPAVELSSITSEELHLLIDVDQLDRYSHWVQHLVSVGSCDTNNDNYSHRDAKEGKGSVQTTYPFHMFVTCNRISTLIYRKTRDESSLHPYLPYVSVCFIQPHVLLQKDKSELAAYDLRFQLPCWGDRSPIRSSSLPDETLFPISLLETRLGPPSSSTGVPPSFLTLRYEPAADRITLNLGRPLKLILHRDNIAHLLFLLHQLEEFQAGDASESVGERTSCPFFFPFREVHLDAVQMVAELPLLPSNVVLTGGLNKLQLKLLSVADAKGERAERLNAVLQVGSLSIKADGDNNVVQLCDPINFDLRAQLFWPRWMTPGNNESPLVHAFCRVDNMRLRVGPRQILVLWALGTWLRETCPAFQIDEDEAIPINPKPLVHNNEPEIDEQHYQDDLRTGAFDFQVRDPSKNGTDTSVSGGIQEDDRPNPYQVVFNVQPASMCWAYPQPRALTRVDVYPIPLLKADGPGTHRDSSTSSETEEQVECLLEYWDYCSEQFRTLRRFSLSETRFTRVPLPHVPQVSTKSGTNLEHANSDLNEDIPNAEEELLDKRVVFSDLWRIVMHFAEDNIRTEGGRPKKIIAAPPSLVACTRVDSYFNAALVPAFQLGATFSHLSMTFHNQLNLPFPPGSASCHLENSFQPDGTVPSDFPFAAITFNQTSIGFHCPRSKTDASLNLSTQLQASLINFQYLVEESVLEPSALEVSVSLSDEGKTITALLSGLRAIDINLSQCTLHALSVCLTSWNSLLLRDLVTEGHRPFGLGSGGGASVTPLYTHYIIRNDTFDVLRIGQSGTGESIPILSRHCHQYAWKVMGRKNRMQGCTEAGRWRWCQPICIDRPGSTVRLVVDSGGKTVKLPLIWTVKPINHLQKEITVRGQVQVANLLQQGLEVKLLPVKGPMDGSTASPNSILVVGEMRASVPALSVPPSFVFPLDQLQGVKVRLPGNVWSGFIPVLAAPGAESKSRNVLLVRVAQKESEESINLWCHLWTEKVDQNHSRLLILFSPLYMVRSYLPNPLQLHLRTPGLNVSQHSEIPGRNRLSVLDCPGTVDHGHQLSFQLSSDLPESTPPVPLSWTMASQNSSTANSSSQGAFIDSLLNELFPSVKDRTVDEKEWPYTSAEEDSFESLAAAPQQPKTDVRVTFSNLNSRCHSLLVELKPWALLVNQTGTNILLRRTGDDPADVWTIPNRSVMAPPPMSETTFQIGLTLGGADSGRNFFSSALLLQDAEHYRFMSYRPKLEGTVPLEGFCFVRIPITDDGTICFLTLSSKMHDGIRILCLHATFRMRNETDFQLKSACFLASERKDVSSSSSWRQYVIQGRRAGSGNNCASKATPLLFWNFEKSPDRWASSDPFVSLRLCSGWSYPIQIPSANLRNSSGANSLSTPQRHVLSVPLSQKCTAGSGRTPLVSNVPFSVTVVEQNGLVYLSVAVDSLPTWIILNRTCSPIVYAQASDAEPGLPESDCPSLDWSPASAGNVIQPDCAAFYTPPWFQQRYPDISPPVNLPRLMFALLPEGDSSAVKLMWGHPIHPSHSYDQFLNLTSPVRSEGVQDRGLDVIVRILCTSVPNQTAIYVEPVSRVEISAKDIRGRISAPPNPPASEMVTPASHPQRLTIGRAGSWCTSPVPPPPSPGAPGIGGELCAGAHRFGSSLLDSHLLAEEAGSNWNASFHLPELSICFRDDTRPRRNEVARVSVDQLLVDYRRNRNQKAAIIRFGHLQVDNQMYRRNNTSPEAGDDQSEETASNGFDFPVVLLAQTPPEWPSTNSRVMPLTRLLESVRQKALVTIDLGLSSSGTPSSLELDVQPIFLFVEDHFLFALLNYFNSFNVQTQPSGQGADRLCARRSSRRRRSSPVHRDPPGELVSFPARISDLLSSGLSPAVNLERITVRAMSLDLSLRSSIKLYIALDHSPLRLDSFERNWVSTTPYRLGQTLAMHYVASAIFKAGWVVGSLELFGSPTALARTVTLGLKDFVRLPYQGIFRGPRGFVAGIVNGSASLVSHVTAGTVTSVTQLASSVARNVDRLSFDSDFQQRSEEGRRKKPQGLVQGIGWGLSALGLSLLGALGGLAHHPLSSLMEDGTFSPRNLAVGITKGIVGVVAKPISGAADLVAQTGQGLLSSTQLNEFFAARRPPNLSSNSDHQLELFCSGMAKVLWKLNDETPPFKMSGIGHLHPSAAASSRICCCLEAMRSRVNDALPVRGQLAPVVIVVSTQNFCILNAEDGELQVVLDLNEVECWAHQTDPTLILVRPTPLSPPPIRLPVDDPAIAAEVGSPHYDYHRVSEFVRLTTPFVLPEAANVLADGDANAQQDDPAASSIATMEFFLSPTAKDFLLQCFQLAKQQRKGLGFPLV